MIMARRHVLGSEALTRRLAQIPDQVLRDLRPALVRGAEDIADTAELLVPEDEGDLKNSITVTGPGDMTPNYTTGGSQLVPMNMAVVTVGSEDVRTGHLQEFGTAHHEAQPFLRPAFRLKKMKVMRRIETALRKAIKRIGA